MFSLSDVLRVVAALMVAAIIIVGAIMLPTLMGSTLPPLPTLGPTPGATTAEVVATVVESTLTTPSTPTRGANTTTQPVSSPTPQVPDTATPAPAATPTASATRAVVRPPTSTPRPAQNPTATATRIPATTPTSTPELTRDPCADSSGYAWTVVSADPQLVPAAGAVVSGPQQELSATWAFVNSGACAWPVLRFEFSPTGRSPAPVAVHRLATQSDATSLDIRPGERAEAMLKLAAREVPAAALDWVWTVSVEIERPDGVLVLPLGELNLVIGQAWVTQATATPRPTPVVAQLPTSTPTAPAPPPTPPRLVKPNPPAETQTFQGEETFSGYDALVEFGWEQDGRSLQPDEYYVVAITHGQGVEYRWAGQATWYRPPPTQEGSLSWLIDLADQVGRLWWRVLIVRTATPREVGPPGPDDVIVAQSADSSFRWVKPGPSSGGGGSQSPGGGID